MQRQISELKKDKESLVVKFEEEEERLINELNRKLTQLQKDKDKLERTLAKEQEAQVNKASLPYFSKFDQEASFIMCSVFPLRLFR